MTISEIECHGMVQTINAYRYLLRNVTFEVVTDHSALIQIHKSKHEPATLRLKKYFEKLAGYRFYLRYLKGKEMFLADHLSRHPTCEVDDDRPIAFSVIYERIFPKGVSCDNYHYHNGTTMEEERSDEVSERTHEGTSDSAHLMVTTRSSAKATGDTLSKGLPAPTRATRTKRQSNDCQTSSFLIVLTI